MPKVQYNPNTGKVQYNPDTSKVLMTGYEIGDTCSCCDDTLWDVGETPKYVDIIFTGILKCPGAPEDPPNDHVFSLPQNSEIYPCSYHIYEEVGGFEWLVFVGFVGVGGACPGEDLTLVYLANSELTWYMFFYEDAPQCQAGPFNNQCVCNSAYKGYDGQAAISW